jgi:hypothetical protein
MTTAPRIYSPALELVTAWLFGILGFMVCSMIFWFIYSIATGDIVEGGIAEILNNNALTAFEKTFRSIPSFIAVFVFFTVALAAGSLPQLIVLAFPVMYYLSKGLESDAKRGWIFYILAGAIIGGGPWMVFEHFAIGPDGDFESRAVFIVPGLVSGILAGAILKARLMKLSRHHHVPMQMPSQTGST